MEKGQTMAEGIRIPSRETASDWLDEISQKSGKVLEQVRNKVTRRKEQRTVGSFLKQNMWLPILLAAIVGVVVVARSRHNLDLMAPDMDIDYDENRFA
jgi:hypothetical protein